MRGGASRRGGPTNYQRTALCQGGVLASCPLYHRSFFLLPTVYSSIGFPDLEIRAGGVLPTVGGFFPPRGVLPTVGFFFLLSAFRIWKQGRAGGVFFPRLSGFGNRVVEGGGLLPRLSGFGNRVHAGGVCRYTQGGCRSTKLRHRHCPKSTVSSIILVPSDFRIWKQGAVSVIRRGGRFSKFRHL